MSTTDRTVSAARKQARTAAYNADMATMSGAHIYDVADAASDVWEPLVRELLEAIERQGAGVALQRVVDQAKEALG